MQLGQVHQRCARHFDRGLAFDHVRQSGDLIQRGQFDIRQRHVQGAMTLRLMHGRLLRLGKRLMHRLGMDLEAGDRLTAVFQAQGIGSLNNRLRRMAGITVVGDVFDPIGQVVQHLAAQAQQVITGRLLRGQPVVVELLAGPASLAKVTQAHHA